MARHRHAGNPAEPCSSVNDGCLAPPAIMNATTRARCFACGLPVCLNDNCSRRTYYLTYGKRRLCAQCLDERQRAQEQEQRRA